MLLLAIRPAHAQTLWARQEHAYANGELHALPDGKSLVHQLSPLPSAELVMFRHVVFDTLLRQRRQASFFLRGYDLHLTGHGLNQRAALYRFRRKANDTVFTAVVDTAGRVLSFRPERQNQPLPTQLPPLPLASDSLFLLCNRPNSEQKFTLECLDLQQRVRWQLPFAPAKGYARLLGFHSDAQYIWLVVADDLGGHTAWCLEMRTGRVVTRTPISQPDSRRLVSATLLLPDHSLAVAGRAFSLRAYERQGNVSTGDLFLTRLQPDGTRLLDNVNDNQGPKRSDFFGTNKEVYWEHLGIDSAGNYFLLGETFGSTSAASGTAQSVAAAALIGVYGFNLTSLSPLDFVRVQLDAKGAVTATALVPLPPGPTLTNLAHWPAQYMAQYAEAKGIFRFRASANDGNSVVVRNKKDLSLLNLNTQQLTVLRTGPALENLEVWGARHNRALLFRAHPAKSPEPAPEWVSFR